MSLGSSQEGSRPDPAMHRVRRKVSTAGQQVCHISTAVWGTWHVEMFLRINLPTLLAPDNLPLLASKIPAIYRIFTTKEDEKTIKASPAFDQLQKIVQTEVVRIPRKAIKDPIATHHRLWRQSIQDAEAAGAIVLFMPPDVLWSNGSMGHVADALSAGKRALFMTYVRVVSETIVDELRHRFAASGSVAAIEGRELMGIALRHLHPVMAAYFRDGRNFPLHAEMMMWAVGDDGFVLRLFARELFAFDPGQFPLNEQLLLREQPGDGDVHIVNDSDRLLGLSLTPFWKDSEWYVEPRRPDPLQIGRWWLVYHSPFNTQLARHNLRFRSGGADNSLWRRVEIEADAFVLRCILARNVIRLILHLQKIGCEGAARIAAAALRHGRLIRRLTERRELLILAPTDAALSEMPREQLDEMLRAGQESKLLTLIKAHIAPLLSDRVDAPDIGPATTLSITTLTGTTLDINIDGSNRLEREEGSSTLYPFRVLKIDRLLIKPPAEISGLEISA